MLQREGKRKKKKMGNNDFDKIKLRYFLWINLYGI